MMLSRRGFIGGLVGIVASPAIVRAASLMPVKVYPVPPWLAEVERMAASIPRMMDMVGYYPVIVSPRLYRDLRQQPEYGERLARGMILEQKPIPVEIGSYQGVRFVGFNNARVHARRKATA